MDVHETKTVDIRNPKRQKLDPEVERDDITVATVQFTHVANDKEANFQIIRGFAEKASKHSQNVKVLIFPEMCITGYWHARNLSKEQLCELAEQVPQGPSTQEIIKLAKDYNMMIGAGLIEITESGDLFNTFVVSLPNGEVVLHRKIHCFISKHMKSGQEYTVFDAFGWKFGILTCYDNNIFENARITALKGAEILLAPHQTGGCLSRSPDAMGLIDPNLWKERNTKEGAEALKAEFQGPKGREWLMRWLPSRAHDNGMFYLFSNGVGLDDNEVRTGNAMIIDPYGKILAESTSIANDIVYATLKVSRIEMCTGQRWLRGRRPELYGLLAQKTGKEMDPRNARFSKKSTNDTSASAL